MGRIRGGAILVATGASLAFSHFFAAKMPVMTPLHAVILGVILSSTAVVGDLIESLFKREDFAGQFGQREKCAVGQEYPLGHQRVDVRVRMDELAERLNGADHARHGVGPTAGGAVNGDHGAGGGAAQFAQEPALEPEIDPQPLGNREHELAVGHLGANVFGHPTRLLQRPLLVA